VEEKDWPTLLVIFISALSKISPFIIDKPYNYNSCLIEEREQKCCNALDLLVKAQVGPRIENFPIWFLLLNR